MAAGRVAWVAAWACGVIAPAFASAQNLDTRTVSAMRGNSFIIEEAYNQEPGTVQHILSARRLGRDWDFDFRQEWGLFSPAHQFSFSVPYSRNVSSPAVVPGPRQPVSNSSTGIGDTSFSYRYQLLDETGMLPAIAPRISVIAPTGDDRRGFGTGATGTRFNLPISKVLGDLFAVHGNLGHTRYFDVEGLETKSYHAGGSFIYAYSRNLNFMFEFLREWDQAVDAGALVRATRYTVSPGIRYSFDVKVENFGVGQLVLGFGAPMVFTSGAKDSYGAIFYASFEHAFKRKNRFEFEIQPNADRRR
jgi:hypothetical protein